MRIGNYETGLDLSFSADEAKIINSDRVNVTIDSDAKEGDPWITVEAAAEGRLKISRRKADGVPTLRMRLPPDVPKLPIFGIEEVHTWAAEDESNVLCGDKPKMGNGVLKRGSARVASGETERRVPHANVHAAVKTVNTFLSQNNNAKAAIRDNVLKLTLEIEFGK